MRRLNLVAGAAFLLSACSVTQESPKVGADKDEHGCIGSAGYAWCETTNQCERSWELAQEQGFENTPESFALFCSP